MIGALDKIATSSLEKNDSSSKGSGIEETVPNDKEINTIDGNDDILLLEDIDGMILWSQQFCFESCFNKRISSNFPKYLDQDVASSQLSPFQIPNKKPEVICSFLKSHPVQPSTCRLSQLFIRSSSGQKKVKRNWLSYDFDNDKYYCYICMAFAKESSNMFQKGTVLDAKHCTTRVKEHEGTSSHVSAAEKFIRYDRSRSIADFVNYEQHSVRLREVRNNQEIVKCIIDWILCIGRQGISYRGACESAKFFNDPSLNHGNLLEILMTASKRDDMLKAHLDKCGKFLMIDPEKKGPRGRGSKVTFLSKSTFNKLINEIGGAIKKKIVDEVTASGVYSLMADGTQDITGHEQCSVVVRYINSVTFKVEERSIGLLRLTDASGEGYLEAIVPYLRKLGINPLLMISCSFDGAMSMRSDEVGLQGRLKQINEDLVYTWCYAHKLNLSVSSSVSCVLSAKNLFGLLQATHNFCSESYKRTIQWENVAKELKGHKKLLKFENFGKTRWYSHDRSLRKIFKSYNDTDIDVYVTLIKFLYNVKTGKSFDSKASFEASALLDSWTKMETILTAFTFLRIFDQLGPTSKYFQTKGLNMMAAVKMVQSAAEDIKSDRDSFDELNDRAVGFVTAVNKKIISETDMDVSVEEMIPITRTRRVKRRDGEIASDEPIVDALDKYRVNQYQVIYDTTYQSLTERFSGESNELIEEMSLFHPDSFEKVSRLKTLELPFLARVLKIESNLLAEELKHFSKNFSSLSIVTDIENMVLIEDEEEDEDVVDPDEDEEAEGTDEDERDAEQKLHKCKTGKPCNKCLACCFILLCKLNLHISTYTNLHRAYEYFMTLPCTEVACERAFSKLKIIKSRLRSALLQQHLDSLLLMYVERELTYELDIDEIVKSFARTSRELTRLLIA